MENFEFNSQICTTREQSERLLELGLKKETADMVYTNASLPFIEEKFNIICKEYSQLNNEVNYEISPFTFIPAWSLHRLLCIVKKCRVINYSLIVDTNNIFPSAIKAIENLIKEGGFNKEYLEEKQ